MKTFKAFAQYCGKAFALSLYAEFAAGGEQRRVVSCRSRKLLRHDFGGNNDMKQLPPIAAGKTVREAEAFEYPL